MPIWRKAFTTRDYNPNYDENYEILEKIGDAAMKDAFIPYIINRYARQNRRLDQREISLVQARYLSGRELAPIASRLNLSRYVLSLLDKSMKTYEDVFEAVVGALKIIGDYKFDRGQGQLIVEEFVTSIFDQVMIDENVFSGDPKSQVKELLKDKLGLIREVSDLEYWTESEEGLGGILILQLPAQAVAELKSLGIEMSIPQLARVESTSIKAARQQAYKDALAVLTDWGVTSQWSKEIKFTNLFETPELASYYPNAIARAKKEGYVSLDFSIPRRNNVSGCYIQLYGVLPDGRQEVLSMVINCDVKEGRRFLLQKYAEGLIK